MPISAPCADDGAPPRIVVLYGYVPISGVVVAPFLSVATNQVLTIDEGRLTFVDNVVGVTHMGAGIMRTLDDAPTGTRPALARAVSPRKNGMPAAGWDAGSRPARVAGDQSDQEETT
jgi:hypothetical protein